jgi:hypothetical protein
VRKRDEKIWSKREKERRKERKKFRERERCIKK